MSEVKNDVRYAGFFIRLLASLIDTFVMTLPIAVVVYFLSDGAWFDFAQYQQNMQAALVGSTKALETQPQTSMSWEFLFEGLVLFTTIIFWRRWMGATPGKHFVGIKVVDKDSFEVVTTKESIIRIIGYFVTGFLFFIAIALMIFRKDKRTLHDMLANTAVIYDDKKDVEGKDDEDTN